MTFFCYAFVNMGMVSGILPVVGVPLPLVSYGGTATLSIMTILALLMGIANQKKDNKGRLKKLTPPLSDGLCRQGSVRRPKATHATLFTTLPNTKGRLKTHTGTTKSKHSAHNGKNRR